MTESNILYRTLNRDEIRLLHQIDRSETVERIWYMENGEMVLKDELWQVGDWSAKEKARRITAQEQSYDRGATFFGAFDGGQFVGMAVLDHAFLSGQRKRLNLEGLWISSAYRGRGVGKTLFELAADLTEEMGAEAMYVSATPSENTVRFYQRRGCVPANPIDPVLFEKEPEDIHLEFPLS